MTAKRRSTKSRRRRRTSSSTKLDFPDPPVPVTPTTNPLEAAAFASTCSNTSAYFSG